MATNDSRHRLMTVPPFFAVNPSQLLLPREVVERDRMNGGGGEAPMSDESTTDVGIP